MSEHNRSGQPVKHGYVRLPRDWKYSTFQRWVSLGLYEPDWSDRLVIEGDFGELAE